MKKHFMFFLSLCLFAFACEQESILPEWTDQNYELNDRGRHCDMNQIPLYIPPAEAAEGGVLDFATAFPVTASTDYESANESDIAIQHVNYSVNGSPIADIFEYQNNTTYSLAAEVIYSIGNEDMNEVFSLAFKVTPNHKILWRANFCMHDGQENQESSGDIDFRTIESIILAD